MILKNENIIEDMTDILVELSQYVPVTACEKRDVNTQMIVADDALHPILLGGDPTYSKTNRNSQRA